MGIKLVTRSRYLGGFIGDEAAEIEWITEKVQGWTQSAETMTGAAHRNLQIAYDDLPPKRVVFRPLFNHWSRIGLSPGRGSSPILVHPGPLKRCNR